MVETMCEIAALLLVIGVLGLYRIWGIHAEPTSSVEAEAPIPEATRAWTGSTRYLTRHPAAASARRGRKRNRIGQPTLDHGRRMGWQHKLLVTVLAALSGKQAGNPSHGRP